MHRWTPTSRTLLELLPLTTILASAKQSEPGEWQSDSRFSERRRRAEISGGGEGSEERVSALLATQHMLLLLLFSFESDKAILPIRERERVYLTWEGIDIGEREGESFKLLTN